MRAIVRERFGGPDCLVIKEAPEPEPKPGYVVIQVKAFGINSASLRFIPLDQFESEGYGDYRKLFDAQVNE
jgi:NADPH:quinone reductase-like Zn-dependent oxidoreductase